jgi:NADPH:quinone reductase-like Zn-dependent oxidoreductase
MFGISVASDSGRLAPLKLLGTALGMPLFHPLSLMNQNRGVFGVNMGHLWHEPEKIRLWADSVLRGVADGWARPHVDKAFPFDRAGEAHAHIEERRNIGKVVLTP